MSRVQATAIEDGYLRQPDSWIDTEHGRVASFGPHNNSNLDGPTVDAFGEEWTKFHTFEEAEITAIGNDYFDVVTSTMLNEQSRALDLGCGSGRFTYYAASRAGFVEAIDPSKSVVVAQAATHQLLNVRVTQASASNLPFPDRSFDFIFCLGVLHHVPDPQRALQEATSKLKTGGYLLVYLYYALENRGPLYKACFKVSEVMRWAISKTNGSVKRLVCDVIAIVVYLPWILLARLLRATGGNTWQKIPLGYYSNKSWRTIRNDALDRFGTPLQKRFTKQQVADMMREAGITELTFSPNMPYWHVVGKKL